MSLAPRASLCAFSRFKKGCLCKPVHPIDRLIPRFVHNTAHAHTYTKESKKVKSLPTRPPKESDEEEDDEEEEQMRMRII